MKLSTLTSLSMLTVFVAAPLAHAQMATPPGGVADEPDEDLVGFRRKQDSFPLDLRGRRVALGDVDLDGDPDALIGGKLLLNDGSGTFSEAPRKVNCRQGARAALLLDYDQDGDLDVFLSGPDRLMQNRQIPDGRLHFVNVSAEAGIVDDGLPGEGLAAGDVNGDGFPDIYLANYEDADGSARGTPDRLYLSNGRGGFTTDGQVALRLCGRGAAMADFDQDGDLDIYVSNYRLQQNVLWINNLEDTGGYSLRTESNALGLSGGYAHTIGSVWGDLDCDGDLDLFMGNFSHRGPGWGPQPMVQVCLQQPAPAATWPFFWRRGDDEERGLAWSAPSPSSPPSFASRPGSDYGISWREPHSNPTLLDFDDDGDLDLYLTTTYGQSSDLYRNLQVQQGSLSFRNATENLRAQTFGAWGAAVADVDLDGDQDLVVCVDGRNPVLLRNERAQRMTRRGSVRLRLRGTTSDTWGVGATAILSGGGANRTVRQLSMGHGTSSQSEPILHFGVLRARGPFEVEVRWPSGKVSRVTVPAGLHEVSEPE